MSQQNPSDPAISPASPKAANPKAADPKAVSPEIVNGADPTPFEEDPSPAKATDETLLVDVRGFEGPLDLLLSLARDQKVDLTEISILALAEQYLEAVDRSRFLRLEIAADYLVMAAWLAYLKSRLLLPEQEDEDEEPSGEEMAAILQFRLQRLEAMRQTAARLMKGNRLGRDVFARGDPEPLQVENVARYSATLYELLTAYATQRSRTAVSTMTMKKRAVWSHAEAREILERIIGDLADWTPITVFLSPYLTATNRATALASTFSVGLELAKEGAVRLQQSAAMAPLMIRRSTAEERAKTQLPKTRLPSGHLPNMHLQREPEAGEQPVDRSNGQGEIKESDI